MLTTTYTTESGSRYDRCLGWVRQDPGGRGKGASADWRRTRGVSLVPAAAVRPGQSGQVLEIVYEDGRRLVTSRVVSVRTTTGLAAAA